MKRRLLKIVDSLNLFHFFNFFTKNSAMVFMMHNFCGWGERDGASHPADILDASLRYLSHNNYSVLPLSEYIKKLKEHSRLYKSVVFSVDDGYHDFYDCAYPVFKKHKIPAAVFLTSDFIDGKLDLWWDQVRHVITHNEEPELKLELHGEPSSFSLRNADERKHAIHAVIDYCKTIPDDQRCALVNNLTMKFDGYSSGYYQKKRPLLWDHIYEMQKHNIEFFPHTKTHPVLSRCTVEKVRHEISESKKSLEAKLKKPADIFCYPNGKYDDFNNDIISILQEEGYTAALTAEEGFDNAQRNTDLYRLRRYPFPNDLLKFKQLVSGLERFKEASR